MKARSFLTLIIEEIRANGAPIDDDFYGLIKTNPCLDREVNADRIIALLNMITPRFCVDYSERLDREDPRRLLRQTGEILQKCINAHERRCGRCNRRQAVTFVFGRFLNTYVCFETFDYLPEIPMANLALFRESDPDNYLDGRVDHMTSGVIALFAGLQVKPEFDPRYN
ncbi:MAG: hypothetical protein HZC01_04310 [Candidatus Kerfeldbacteria bacterium]|nr:hypothetical protein [Candidatus Kerfeldbacteria bacterium]